MAVESFGSWSDSAQAILREVAERRSAASQGTLSRGKAFQRLLTEMNVTLMRAQARMLVSRMPAENLRPSLRTWGRENNGNMCEALSVVSWKKKDLLSTLLSLNLERSSFSGNVPLELLPGQLEKLDPNTFSWC